MHCERRTLHFIDPTIMCLIGHIHLKYELFEIMIFQGIVLFLNVHSVAYISADSTFQILILVKIILYSVSWVFLRRTFLVRIRKIWDNLLKYRKIDIFVQESEEI